jgi:HPt (histidine-containing phosphotransfer) domain-containing protein
MGMDDYLTKPTPLVELQTILERWLPASGPCLDLQATPAPLARVVGPVDLSVLKALVGDDPAVIQELLHVFWVSAAKTAAELKAASKNGQAAQTEALAHKLKSSARAVGALSLGELCAEMEQVGKAGKTEALTGLWLRFEAEIAAVYEYLHSL